MSEVRPEHVIGLWDHLSQHFRTKVVSKPDAIEMRVVAEFLSRLGIIDADRFMKRYATTVGRRIYVPFQIGSSRDRDLWSQLVLGVHEHQHVSQFDDLGALTYALRYLASSSHRAFLEADAYRTNLELYFWRFGGLPKSMPQTTVETLRNYGVRDADIEFAKRVLEMSAETIRRGGIITEASQVAIAWLGKNAPELRLSRELPQPREA